MNKEYIPDPVLRDENECNEGTQSSELTEEKIKQRLSGRASEYFMFLDD